MIEIPAAIALFYPALNLWWIPSIKSRVEGEIEHIGQPVSGVSIYDYTISSIPPHYVNLGIVGVPIGFWSTGRALNHIVSKHRTSFGRLLDNYSQLDDTHAYKTYIHDLDSLKNLCTSYDIQIDQHPFVFPLTVYHYKYTNGCVIHPQLRMLASKHTDLVNRILWRKRLPGTFLLPIAGAALYAYKYYA